MESTVLDLGRVLIPLRKRFHFFSFTKHEQNERMTIQCIDLRTHQSNKHALSALLSRKQDPCSCLRSKCTEAESGEKHSWAEGISQRKGDHRKPSPFMRKGDHRKPSPFIMSSCFTRTKTYPFYYDCPFILSAAGLEPQSPLCQLPTPSFTRT